MFIECNYILISETMNLALRRIVQATLGSLNAKTESDADQTKQLAHSLIQFFDKIGMGVTYKIDPHMSDGHRWYTIQLSPLPTDVPVYDFMIYDYYTIFIIPYVTDQHKVFYKINDILIPEKKALIPIKEPDVHIVTFEHIKDDEVSMRDKWDLLCFTNQHLLSNGTPAGVLIPVDARTIKWCVLTKN